jgi:hypothetical protein
MKLRNFFFFAGSTVNRLDAMVNNNQWWMTKEVSCQDDKVDWTSKCCNFDSFLRCPLLGMAQVGQLKVIIT